MTNEEVIKKADEDFLLRRYSENTISTYKVYWQQFLLFSKKEEYAALDEFDLRQYLLYMRKNETVSDSTTNTINSACKFLLKIVLELTINESRVPNARTQHKLQLYFSLPELKLFFSRLLDIRNFAFFLTLYGTGMRISELCSVEVDDIESNIGETAFIYVRNGKGKKERKVILPQPCLRALRQYWSIEKPGNDLNLLFPGKNRSKTPTSHFNLVFRSIIKYTKLNKEFHPHCLRHTFAHNILQNNPNSILTLKNQLGHSSLASTEIYLRSSSVDSSNKLSPAEICELLYSSYLECHEE